MKLRHTFQVFHAAICLDSASKLYVFLMEGLSCCMAIPCGLTVKTRDHASCWFHGGRYTCIMDLNMRPMIRGKMRLFLQSADSEGVAMIQGCLAKYMHQSETVPGDKGSFGVAGSFGFLEAGSLSPAPRSVTSAISTMALLSRATMFLAWSTLRMSESTRKSLWVCEFRNPTSGRHRLLRGMKLWRAGRAGSCTGVACEILQQARSKDVFT
jgi:hypothetical protein